MQGRDDHGMRGPRPVGDWDSLTPSEWRVVDLLGDGLTNREIAEILYVSHHTVETHLKHVFAKLGLRSRTQVALAALRRAG